MTTYLPPEGPLPRWLSVNQAAELLGMNPKTIYRRIDDGTFRASRVGPRFLRIETESVLNLLPHTESEGQRHGLEKS